MLQDKRIRHKCALIKLVSQSSRNIKYRTASSSTFENGYSNKSPSHRHTITNSNEIVTQLHKELSCKKALIDDLKAINRTYREETQHQRTIINAILKEAEKRQSASLSFSKEHIDHFHESTYINSLNNTIRDLTKQLTHQRELIIQLKTLCGIDCSYSNNRNEIGALRHENHSVKFKLLNMNMKYRNISDKHKSLTEKMKKANKCLRLIKNKSKEKDLLIKRILRPRQGHDLEDCYGSMGSLSRNELNSYRNQSQTNSVIIIPNDRLPLKNESDYLRKQVEREREVINGIDKLSVLKGIQQSNSNKSTNELKELKLKIAQKNNAYKETVVKYNNAIKEKNQIEIKRNEAKESIKNVNRDNAELKRVINEQSVLIELYKNLLENCKKTISPLKQKEKEEVTNDKLRTNMSRPIANIIQSVVCRVEYIHQQLDINISKSRFESNVEIDINERISYVGVKRFKAISFEKLKPLSIETHKLINGGLLKKDKETHRHWDKEIDICHLNHFSIKESAFVVSNKSNKEIEILKNKKHINEANDSIELRMKKNYIRNKQAMKSKNIQIHLLDQPVIISHLTSNDSNESNKQIQSLLSQVKELNSENKRLAFDYNLLKTRLEKLKRETCIQLESPKDQLSDQKRIQNSLNTFEHHFSFLKEEGIDSVSNNDKKSKLSLSNTLKHREHLVDTVLSFSIQCNLKSKKKPNDEKNSQLTIQSLSDMNLEYINHFYSNKTYLKPLTISNRNESLILDKQTIQSSSPTIDKEANENIQLLDEYIKQYENNLNDEMIKSNVLKQIAIEEQAKYRRIRDKYNKAKERLIEKTNLNQSNNKTPLNEGMHLFYSFKKTQDDAQEPDKEMSNDVDDGKSHDIVSEKNTKDQRRPTAQFKNPSIHNSIFEDSKLSKTNQEVIRTEDDINEITDKDSNSNFIRNNNRLLSFMPNNTSADNYNDNNEL